MNITNNNVSIDDTNIYNASSPPPKAVDGTAFVSFLADELASQPGSFSAESAESARDVLTKQMNQDPMFMAGTGLKGLGYTFLLLQTFAELEMDMIKNANKQSALTSQMYEKLSEAEFRIADDIWKSGLAKGISQIAGGATQMGIAAYSARQQQKAFEGNKAVLEANPATPPPIDSSMAPSPAVPSIGVATASGSAVQPSGPAPANPPVTPVAHVDGEIPSAAGTPPSAAGTPPSAPAILSKEQQAELANDKSFYHTLGQSANEIITGVGGIFSAYYDADGKKEEGLKQLIQMVINNADTQKQRLQQQYEEASKKMEEAVQAYNAAAQASH